MSSTTTLLGRWGEEQVGKYLRKQGYRLLASGYRCRMGEIDLIAQKRDVLAFVEVKLRKNADFAPALEQVTPAKQRRIRTTAAFYLAQNAALAELHCRFDVAEVYAIEGAQTRKPEIRYYENAFW
jgi:putative endonuclease